MECKNECENITVLDGNLWCKYYEEWLEHDIDESGETFTVFRCPECENKTKDCEYKHSSSKRLLEQVDIISEAFVEFQTTFTTGIKDLYYLVRDEYEKK